MATIYETDLQLFPKKRRSETAKTLKNSAVKSGIPKMGGLFPTKSQRVEGENKFCLQKERTLN